MQSDEVNEHLLNLSHAIKSKKSILFIGSGFSLNAEKIHPHVSSKFLTWSKLIDKMLNGFSESADEIKSNHPYPHIIQLIEDRFGLQRRNRAIKNAIPDADYKPGVLHQEILNTRYFPWQAIITTNIDTLIEKTLLELDVAHTPVVQASDFTNISGIPVFKMHGSIEQEDSYVFSENEYLDFETKKSSFVTKLRSLFLENNCLFLGYSLADPDFKQIYHSVEQVLGFQRQSRPTSYTFMYSTPDYNVEYWRKKSLIVLSKQTIGNQISLDSESSIKHKEFLQLSFKYLRSLSDHFPETMLDVSNPNQYRNHEIRIYLDKLNAEVFKRLKKNWQKIRSFVIQPVPKFNLDVESEKTQQYIKEYFNDYFEIRRCSHPEYMPDLLMNIRKQLLGLMHGHLSEDLDVNFYIIYYILKNTKRHADDLTKALTFLNDFLNIIIPRPASSLDYLINFRKWHVWIKKLHNLKGSDGTQSLLSEDQIRQLYIVVLYSGQGIDEKILARMLDLMIKKIPAGSKEEMLLTYRRQICRIYLTDLDGIQNFLENNLIVKHPQWPRIWSAYLYLELGWQNQARELYEEVARDQNLVFSQRFVAMQALYMIPAKTEDDSIKSWEQENQKDHEVQKEMHFLKQQARARHLDIQPANFLESYDRVNYQLSNWAYKIEEGNRKKKNNFRVMSINVGGMQLFSGMIVKHWSAGMPQNWLREKAGLYYIDALLENGISPDSVLELNQIAHFCNDWADTRMRSACLRFAARRVNFWLELQISQVTNLRCVLLFYLNKCKNLDDKGKHSIRSKYMGLLSFFNVNAEYLSQPTLNKIGELLLELAGQKDIDEQQFQAQDWLYLASIFNIVLMSQTVKGRVCYFIKFSVDFWIDFPGAYVWERCDALHDPTIWTHLDDVFKESLFHIFSNTKKNHSAEILNAAVSFARMLCKADLAERERLYQYCEALHAQIIANKKTEYSNFIIHADNNTTQGAFALYYRQELSELEQGTDQNTKKLDFIRQILNLDSISETRESVQKFASAYLNKDLENEGVSSNFFGDLLRLIEREIPDELRQQIVNKMITDLQNIQHQVPHNPLDGWDVILSSLFHNGGLFLLYTQEYDIFFDFLKLRPIWEVTVQAEDMKKLREYAELNPGARCSFHFKRWFLEQKGRTIGLEFYIFMEDYFEHATLVTGEDIALLEILWYTVDQEKLKFGFLLSIAAIFENLTQIDVFDLAYYMESWRPDLLNQIPAPNHARLIQTFLKNTKHVWESKPLIMKRIAKINNLLENLEYPEYLKKSVSL